MTITADVSLIKAYSDLKIYDSRIKLENSLLCLCGPRFELVHERVVGLLLFVVVVKDERELPAALLAVQPCMAVGETP